MGRKSREKWERRLAEAMALAAAQDSADKKPDYGLYTGVLSLFGAFIFFVLQSNGVEVRWDVSAGIYAVCLLAIGWSTATHLLSPMKKWRFIAAIALVLLLSGPCVYGTMKQYEKDHPQKQLILPPPKADYMEYYGTLDPTGKTTVKGGKVVGGNSDSQVTADGNRLADYADQYRLIAVCFHWDGVADYKDVHGISKSAVTDIRSGLTPMIIHWNDKFIGELQAGERRTTYVLLLIPKTMTSADIGSERDAINRGAFELAASGGPP